MIYKNLQKFENIIILIGLAISLLLAIYNYYGFTIIDHFSWRQTQTAIAIKEIIRGGPFLEYRVPVLVYPWSIPLELPLYQFTSAKLAQMANINLENAGRIISFVGFGGFIFFFRLTLQAIGYPSLLRIIVLTLIILSPIYLYWSHAVMIETFALMFVGTYLYSAVKMASVKNKMSRIGILYFIILTIAGGLALTAKISTGIIGLLVGGILYLYVCVRDNKFENVFNLLSTFFLRGLNFVALNVGSLLIAIIWLYYADIIKNLDPVLNHLRTENIAKLKPAIAIKKLFGFDPKGLYYSITSKHTFGIIKSWVFIIPLIGIIGHKLILKRDIGLYFVLPILLLGIYFLVPIIFAKKFMVHYYYWVANSYLCFFVIGCGIYSIIKIFKKRYNKFKEIYLAIVFLAMMVTSMLIGYNDSYLGKSQRSQKGRDARIMLIDFINTNVKNPGLLAMTGPSWAPTIPYYTDRYAYMRMPTEYKHFKQEIRRRQTLHPVGDQNQIAIIIDCRKTPRSWDEQQVLKDFGFDTYTEVSKCNIYY